MKYGDRVENKVSGKLGYVLKTLQLMMNVKLDDGQEVVGTDQESWKKVQCDHSHYSFKKHGGICPCATMITDFGD